MSDIKATPGPWYIRPDREFTISADDGNVAEVYIRRSLDEAKVNAHLICAALELYDIVRSLILNEKLLNDDHFQGVQERLMTMARAALAKAAGEKPILPVQATCESNLVTVNDAQVSRERISAGDFSTPHDLLADDAEMGAA